MFPSLSTTLIARLMLNIRDPKLLNPNYHSRLRTATDVSDDLIVTSALATGRPDWTEFGYERELYETESAVHGSRHDGGYEHTPNRWHSDETVQS